MKFRLLSDLHIEFSGNTFQLEPLETDSESCLVLAGDIGVGIGAVPIVEKWAKRFKYLVYVTGNHEFYNHRIQSVNNALRELFQDIPNAYFLEEDYVELEDTVVWGGMVWTDGYTTDPTFDYFVKNRYNDFQVIKRWCPEKQKYVRFDISCMRHYNKIAIDKLKKCVTLNKNKKIVVVTHHHLCGQGVDTKFLGNDLNCLYHNSLEGFFLQNPHVKLCMAGHMHNSSDYMVNQTRFVCNPYGYTGHEVNPNFKQDCILEV